MLLSRDARPLLKTVNKRPHACDDDHEGPPAKQRATPDTAHEEDLYAEPASSDDELRAPPSRSPQPLHTTKKSAASGGGNSSQESKKPQGKPTRSKTQIRAPKKGNFGISHGSNAGKINGENKENTQSSQPSSASKDGDLWAFDPLLKRPPPKGPKKTFDAKSKRTNNIHAPAVKKFGKATYGSKKTTYGKQKLATLERSKSDDESDLSDVSMEELEKEQKETDPELRSCPKKPPPKKQKPMPSSRTLDNDELESVLQENDPKDKDLKRTSRRGKQNHLLLDQLGDWVHDQAAPDSSHSSSNGARQDLDDYIDQLPVDEEEGTICPICKGTVCKETYWAFWKGQDNSIKNQNTFCHVHRKQDAETEYATEGYPAIIWSKLPTRIRKHRMDLYKILTGDKPSAHRDRYSPLALTGKAATVPKIRKDLPLHIQKDLEESNTLDDASTFPGYYGPHGRRVITEAVMKMLKNEIKNCHDPVVQASGPAAFVQAVLVPEVAVRLIMEDCLVDAEGADEVRERTYEMGLLLNEEIEDRVELVAGEEEEEEGNEYDGR